MVLLLFTHTIGGKIASQTGIQLVVLLLFTYAIGGKIALQVCSTTNSGVTTSKANLFVLLI